MTAGVGVDAEKKGNAVDPDVDCKSASRVADGLAASSLPVSNWLSGVGDGVGVGPGVGQGVGSGAGAGVRCGVGSGVRWGVLLPGV